MKICLSCEGVTDEKAHRCGNCDAPLLSTDAVHYPARRGELDAGNPLLGTIIDGKYRLQSVLGRGGLGTVFRAQHVGSLATVALKLLHPRFSERPEYRKALLPEARRAATVVHERCARLLDVGEGDEGITYLAMELVEGQTLDEVLQQGALPPSHCVDLLLQVTAALTAVHEVGLVHCDLSPRNVMVTARSGRLEAKVLDFGIARSMNIAGRRNAQSELWGFANAAFSAPELLLGENVDARADLYSVGTLIWLMLTGTMPVPDSDAEAAAVAVREGRLLPWPAGTRAPKRLVQLMRSCLRFEPDQRPASAQEVHRQLQIVRTGRGPGLSRLAMLVAALALVVTFLAGEAVQPPFLRPVSGSTLELSERALADSSRVHHLVPADLANIVCYYAGFRPNRLRAEITRNGTVLAPFDLSPQGDPQAGTLLLSDAQESWSQVVQGLLRASKEGPVDLVLVVPGTALVRAVRVRVDQQSPTVAARLLEPERGLCADSRLLVELQDDIGVAEAFVLVQFETGDEYRLSLPIESGSFALGAALAQRVPHGVELGPGSLTITAIDAAGNQRTAQPSLPFAAADVSVPHVLAIAGTAGQSSLARHGDRLRFRVQLSWGETGCSLRCHAGVLADAVTVPLPIAKSDTPIWHSLDLLAAQLVGGGREVSLHVAVIDAAGNVDEREFAATVMDRSPVLEVRPVATESAAAVLWTGRELVMTPSGGRVRVTVPAPYAVVGAGVKQLGQLLHPNLVGMQAQASQAELQIGALADGAYELLVDLAEAESAQIEPLIYSINLRVLPEKIAVTVPASKARYLAQLVEDGVLGRRSETTYGEGRGWRVSSDLRPYVGGEMWLGDFQSSVVMSEDALLPAVEPVEGRNLMALRLVDALGRPVVVVDEFGQERRVDNGRQVVADFWWSAELPQLLGEELLVEYGQRVRINIRMPLPLLPSERDAILLSYPNGVKAASKVMPDGAHSLVSFDLEFSEWSQAARLTGESRESYAKGLSSSIQASIATPAQPRLPVTLSLRTTRSTLSPMRLGDVVAVPPGLADLRLLPVLAPAKALVEPTADGFPPRHAFRPQTAVSVRNMPDIMLQDREMVWREARALMDFATRITDAEIRRRCVHCFDPLGLDRLQPHNLLPPPLPGVAQDRVIQPDAAVLAGVDFFQSWTLTRLLGVVVAKDPTLFRLPLGCELELAAYGDVGGLACNGVTARGGAVQAAAFAPDTAPVAPWTPAQERSFGDVIPTSYGPGNEFVGLDFGVREWVLDLPHMPNAEPLLIEWTADHAGHLNRVMDMAMGKDDAQPDPLGLIRQFGVVRGLSFGELGGLLDSAGNALSLPVGAVLPASVPGVLRTEQLSRDGRDLVGRGREPRLLRVGLRVASSAKDLAGRWGYR